MLNLMKNQWVEGNSHAKTYDSHSKTHANSLMPSCGPSWWCASISYSSHERICWTLLLVGQTSDDQPQLYDTPPIPMLFHGLSCSPIPSHALSFMFPNVTNDIITSLSCSHASSSRPRISWSPIPCMMPSYGTGAWSCPSWHTRSAGQSGYEKCIIIISYNQIK